MKSKAEKREQLAKRRMERDAKRPKRPPEEEARSARSAKLPETVIGLKYVRLLQSQLDSLRNEAGEHGNRSLFMDDVFVCYLLAFFNPTVRSLRTIEDLSQTKNVQKHLSIDKVCKSTLSDFNKLTDPERLQPIVAVLRQQLSRKTAGRPLEDRDLQTLLKRTVAVDGTFLPAAANVLWAIANSNSHGTVRYRARVDARLEVSTWLPEALVIPEPQESESDSAIRHVQRGKIYIYDRGYTGFALLKAHYEEDDDIKSHFVVRYKKEGGNCPTLADVQHQQLTDDDRAAGVISDRIGFFKSDGATRAKISHTKLREVVVLYDDNGETKQLRLITNLMDVPAATIALLYQYRWQVELFFRWFKSFGNFGHLISHSRQGALAHLYVTIIAVLLMYLHTGYRPSKYMFAMLSQVAAGAATLEEIIPILRERERRKELDRASAARRRAKKKAESR
jgi:hypothetical protein